MTWKMVDAAAMVREIAAMDPEGRDSYEEVTCVFCHCEWDYQAGKLRHCDLESVTPCLWVRCNALVKEMDGQ